MALSKCLREDLQPIIVFGKDRKQLLQLSMNYTRTVLLSPIQGPCIATITSDDNRNQWTSCLGTLIQISNHVKLYQKKISPGFLRIFLFLKMYMQLNQLKQYIHNFIKKVDSVIVLAELLIWEEKIIFASLAA